MVTQARRRATIAGRALLVSCGVFGVVVATSDLQDGTHSVWRDPISYFGADAAPHPVAFALGLGAVGLSLAAWAFSWRDVAPRPLVSAGVAAGLMTTLLAALPLDCSPVDDLCEVFIRARVHSTSHRVHALVAAGLFTLLTATTVALAVAGWRASDGGRSRLRAVVTGGTAVVLGLRILARPFDEGTALAEVGLVLLSAVSVATFARLDRPGAGP